MTAPGPVTAPVWRYLLGGEVKHSLYSTTDPSAVCGAGPLWYVPDCWRGTGSNAEYLRLAQLRGCRRCAGILRKATPG